MQARVASVIVLAVDILYSSIISYTILSTTSLQNQSTKLQIMAATGKSSHGLSEQIKTELFPQFVLFGDSQIQYSMAVEHGWSFNATLQNDFIRRMDVVNRGFSGYNTTHALAMLPGLLDSLSPGPIRFFFVFFGSNDASLPGATGQHVDLQTYRTNLEAIVTHPKLVAHHPKIILVTSPPVDEVSSQETELKMNISAKPARDAKVTAEYAAAVKEVGERTSADLVVVDLWSRIMDEAIKETPSYISGGPLLGSKELGRSKALDAFLKDGLHLSTRGYQVLYNEMFSAIRERWPEEGPEAHPFVYPYWRDLIAKS